MAGARGRTLSGAREARDTLAGRVSLLSRTGKILLVGGVVLMALTLVVTAVSLYGGDSEQAGADASGGASDSDFDRGDFGGAPQRIEPTALPGAPSESPTGSPSPSPGGSQGEKKPKPPQNVHRPSYSAWAGPGCTGGGGYQERGRFSDGDDGWYTVYTGGHKGDGCDGSFSAVPMSGSPTKDSGGTATWSWYVGSGYATCSVSVAIPESERDRDVAGDPTTYTVLADPADQDSAIKSFEIDQTSLRGRGLIVEKIPVLNQQLTVQLVDRGKDWGSDQRGGAHHAAAQMRADCRA
ncbi:adhesin [Streptomyces sp. NPDC060064]|uniref:adhesin n=1 Tax=Streptomyces sp. NPDC060064 TaxID=3347049 RepID=UPI0036818678